MKFIEWDRNLESAGNSGPVALTIGVFDGIHCGHHRLIDKVVQEKNTEPVLCTFQQIPSRVLGRTGITGYIRSARQKMMKLELLGIAKVVLIDFSVEFSRLTGRQFIHRLQSCLNIKKLVIGYNFCFGRGRSTGPDQLKSMLEGTGIDLEVVSPVLYREEAVSSSRIREAIVQGRFPDVQAMLNDSFILDLLSFRQELIANDWVGLSLEGIEQVLPAQGRYAVTMSFESSEYNDVVEIGKDKISWSRPADAAVEIRFLDKL